MRPRFVLCLLLFSVSGWTQSFTGAIAGRIMDQTSAAVPRARLVAVEENTNVTTETTSDTHGEYAFPSLRPGPYRVEVEVSGFKKLIRSGLDLQVNSHLRVDLSMTLGGVSESVDVTAAAPLVESDSSALGSVVDNRKILNLPLNTRNPFQLAALSPGVIPSVGMGDQFNSSANFMINGGRGNTSEVLIDGITNSVPAANPIAVIAMFPSVDAIQEFKVQTSAYAAEYGRSGGGIINMVIRSGTNQLHGTLFEFLRNSKMDANNFFANRAGNPLGSFKRNQFGASAGGPVVRDKLFFFVNYEALRQRSQDSTTLTVPTALERQGNFSQSRQRAGTACQSVQIFDPLTTRQAAGGGFVRDLFPGNVVPGNRLDVVGSKLLQYFPLPNLPGDACSGVNNYFSSLSSPLTTNQMDMKFDWAPNATHRLSAGLGWRNYEATPPNHYHSIAQTSRYTGDSIPSKAMRLDYVGNYSPTLLFNARFGITRMERVNPPTPLNFSLSDLGFPASLQSQATQPIAFPSATVDGYAPLGNSIAYTYQSGTSFTFNANVTKIRGNHTLKFGIDYRINQSFEKSGFSTSGAFAFSQGFTQGPDPNRASTGMGNSVASLLLGVGSGDMQVIPAVLTSNSYMGLYVQDDFRVSSRLTLNIGLRYDLESGRNERYNQLSYFDFTAPSPLVKSVPSLPNLQGGLRFVGSGTRQFDTDKNNFGPRFGFAYSATSKIAIRGGYGIFYLPFVGEAAGTASGINGFSSDTQWVSSLDGLTPVGYLSNPFPQGLAKPAAPGAGMLTNVGQNIGATDRDGAIDRTSRVGYAQQWNLNIQRQLPGTMVIEVAYAGSKGTKLLDGPRGFQLDQLRPEQLALGTQLQQLVTNPFYGVITSGSLAQPTVTRGQLLRPYPQYLGLLDFRPAAASSSYHAFQARAEKRFSAGLSLLAAYTTSKLIDDSSQAVSFLGPAPEHQNVYDRRADRSVSAQDVSQRLVLSYTYELPIGHGRALGGSLPAWARAIAGDWRINGITTFSTSVPLTLTAAQNTSGSYSAVLRPNMSGAARLDSGRTVSDRLAHWFDTSVFQQPAPFTFGNTPRVLSNVRRDGIRNWDFSLFKEFPIRENFRAELRAEFFNVFNTPQFGAPGTVFGTGQFGVVSSQANIPRQLQLGLKLYF